jgi:DNA-binding NarL/FixJ family response regulator
MTDSIQHMNTIFNEQHSFAVQGAASLNYPMKRSAFPVALERPAVLIADDHILVAQGLCSLIEQDFNVFAIVGNGPELLEAARIRAPDLALIDVSMPGMTGFEATRKLLEIAPQCKVILVSMHATEEFVREAFAVGARGYLVKRAASSELVQAMKSVMNGSSHISSDIAGALLSTFLDRKSLPLTDRQRQVLCLVSTGNSAKEAAANLSISVKTAQFHKTCIMEKLNLHTIAELTRYAIIHGLID